jgi:thiamine biosynthesis lipoprotein
MSGRRIAIELPRGPIEHRHTFACFGGTCTVIVADSRRPAYAAEWSAVAKRSLLSWHGRFSRFEPASELTLFNADPRTEIPVSRMLRRLIEVALSAARDTGGLVDATLGAEIALAGYGSHFDGPGIDLPKALSLAPPPAPAGQSAAAGWRQILVDPVESVVRRTPGTVIDPGGIAKGVFADQLAGALGSFDEFAVDCAGDVRLGGREQAEREVHVSSPFDDSILHAFRLTGGGVATSGIGRRSWIDADGQPAHHLLDPRTGRPAFTGVVQATALAPTAAEAEVLAKAALLSGPERAPDWLVHGGLFVRDDGSYDVLEPAGAETPSASPAVPVAVRSASQERMSPSTASRSGSFRISWKRPS